MALDASARKWLVTRTNPEYVDYISRLVSVSQPFAQLLINRGLRTPGQLDAFLNPDLEKLSDPFELPDLIIAVERIGEAKRRKERVLIHGDYDADGVTATAIMVEGLRQLGLDVHYFIPDRMAHGYGFGMAGIERAREIGAHLIITVDCGITSFEAVTRANSLGMDVIITDHHEPLRQSSVDSRPSSVKEPGDSRLPREDSRRERSVFLVPGAVAVVNPKVSDKTRPSNLSGAGVAFKVMQALFRGSLDDVYPLLDLAALGTAADVVPVLDDNRVILKEGIKLIQSGLRTGIKALKEVSGMRSDPFKTSFLYYGLIPRLNAAGRIAEATDVVRLLTTKSEGEAQGLAQWLNGLNIQRQEVEALVYQEALRMIDSTDWRSSGAIVIASEGWHPGVVGIVASKIAEACCRPTFVLSLEGGVAKGSARSIPPFDLHYGLTQCKEILTRFGGHRQAAGLSLSVEALEQFRMTISDIALKTLSAEDFLPTLQIDAAVTIPGVSMRLIDEISRLEPFGYGNEEPLFGAKGLEVRDPKVVGDNHLRMNLRQNGCSVNCIGFDLGGFAVTLENKNLIDAAFLPIMNEWNGARYVQLSVKALRPTSA